MKIASRLVYCKKNPHPLFGWSFELVLYSDALGLFCFFEYRKSTDEKPPYFSKPARWTDGLRYEDEKLAIVAACDMAIKYADILPATVVTGIRNLKTDMVFEQLALQF